MGPVKLQPSTSTVPRRILSYLDHSDPNLAKTKGLHFEQQERLLQDRVDVSSVGRVFKDGDRTPPMDPTLAVVGGAFGLGTAIASAFVPGALLFLSVPLAAFFLKSSLSEATQMVTQKAFDASNLQFRGSRTWELQGQDSKKGFVDSPLLQEDPAAQPSRDDFAQFVDQHLKADTENVLVLNGHGTAGVQARIGSFPISDVSRVLTKKLQETGLKTSLVVLDSCQLGNLSVLKAFEGLTDFLVASEADIDVAVTSHPSKSFSPYPALSQPASGPKELAGQVVKEAKGVSTLAAYDMEKVPGLFEALDRFGVVLAQNNDRRSVRSMLDAARDATKVSTQSQSTPGVIDLGTFCEVVKKKSPDTETKKLANAVLSQISQVVTDSKTSGKFAQSSHISFQNPNRMSQRDRNALMLSKLPDGWKDFLRTQIVQSS